jgi:hypothetical protein
MIAVIYPMFVFFYSYLLHFVVELSGGEASHWAVAWLN